MLPLAEHLRLGSEDRAGADYATADVLAYVGKNAKTYTIRIWKTDMSGNKAHKDVQVTVHLTKAEADALADISYDSFGIGPTTTPIPGDYKADWIMPYARGPPNNILCNRANIGTSAGHVGHTYNNQSLSESDKAILESDWQNNPMGGDCVNPIERATKTDFLTELTNYLQFLKNAGKF
ncbi:MAG: hypothetical protein QXF55_04025 [Candidatus Aenigmatarchaeota archaeon]